MLLSYVFVQNLTYGGTFHRQLSLLTWICNYETWNKWIQHVPGIFRKSLSLHHYKCYATTSNKFNWLYQWQKFHCYVLLSIFGDHLWHYI